MDNINFLIKKWSFRDGPLPRHRITRHLQHFAKMEVVGTRRECPERYRKSPDLGSMRGKVQLVLFEENITQLGAS